ncbi:delta-60 repeat domain-containing protein [Thermoflexibacter ruber]|uniref:Delta-60 repeat domain-containing protein n=1 Tax=Thermoflexibacter ruber TaxID=1003 RepID=A0A1I2BUV7_9BACT|nr:hypothetical protein [Thermoflexibacter ruber]SFE59899.1 delta-60 repeat domain-containing protein [Thermoflexibacter ruber]
MKKHLPYSHKIWLLGTIICLLSIKTHAQQPGSDFGLQPSLPAEAVSNNVFQKAYALQTDNRLVVGGAFSQVFSVVNNAACNNIARFGALEGVNIGFNVGSGFNNHVYALGLQADGKIVVGGIFTKFNGINANRIARLNTDGGIDASFNVGLGFSSNVNAIAIQADGKIIVGGSFAGFGASTVNGIVRLNADGSLDASFNTGTAFNDAVNTIALQTDGKIIYSIKIGFGFRDMKIPRN